MEIRIEMFNTLICPNYQIMKQLLNDVLKN